MSDGEIILYSTEDGAAEIQLRAVDGTVWLSQIEMAELFQTSKQNVSLHVRNILADGELDPESTVKEYLTVQTEGPRQVKRSVTFCDSAKQAERIAHDRYAAFDETRKAAQALAASESDELEELKRIADGAKGRKKGGGDD